jgi:uncharacterized protein (DUF433 family)
MSTVNEIIDAVKHLTDVEKDEFFGKLQTVSAKAIDFNRAPSLASCPPAELGLRVREDEETAGPNYRGTITVEPGKRGGRPCIRGMRITVGDILGWLAAGMSEAEIVEDFPELTAADIHAALAFAADRERHTMSVAAMLG